MGRIGAQSFRERSKIGNLWRFNRFIDNRCFAPPTSYDGDDVFDRSKRRPFRLLPQRDFIDLFVLKLDGSVFDVHVARNGTVVDLKRAIEEVFNSPEDEHCKIPWSLVWGHFCLCYEGQKLIDDKAYIRVLGIKDGDQLQFVRHMSINYLPMKRDAKNQTVSRKTVSLSPSSESESVEENQLAGPDRHENHEVSKDGSNQEEVPLSGFKLGNFFRRRLLNSRVWGLLKSASEGRNRLSNFSVRYLT